MKSKLVWANWDAEELLERAEEISGSKLLTTILEGYPFRLDITLPLSSLHVTGHGV